MTCLVRRTSNLTWLANLGVSTVEGDVTNPEGLTRAVAGQEIIYHLAGCVKSLDAAAMIRVNRDGSANLARAAAAQPSPPVLVVLSSLAAAGPSLVDRPRVESDPPAPVSIYGRSKREGELEVQRHADRVPVSVIRPPIVLGEADRTGMPLFESVARWNVHAVPGLRPNRFSLIHAADLAAAMILVAQRGKRLAPSTADPEKASQGFYFVAAEEHPTYAELGRLIARASGRARVPVVRLPLAMMWAVSTAMEWASQLRGTPSILNCDKLREIRAGSWTCSPQKAIDELGFRVAAPLIDRLRQTVDWYRRHNWRF